jgi:predicted acetyltransferase
MADFELRPANAAADRPAIEHLWQLFRHDMSEFQGQLPNRDGTFRTERLQHALTDPDWRPYLITRNDQPIGFAFVRNLTGALRVLNSFFIVRAVRREGIGLRAVQDVLRSHAGPWQIAFQDSNTAAVRFWRRVATEIAGDKWTEERRPVPDRPDVPPDVWISFEVPAA